MTTQSAIALNPNLSFRKYATLLNIKKLGQGKKKKLQLLFTKLFPKDDLTWPLKPVANSSFICLRPRVDAVLTNVYM